MDVPVPRESEDPIFALVRLE